MSNNSLFAFGLGIGTQNSKQEWLEVFFPNPLLQPEAATITELATLLGYKGGQQSLQLSSSQRSALAKIAPEFANFAAADRPVVAVFLAADEPLVSVPEAYLKLHLLSHRLVHPNTINLTGLFKILPNVAWTNQGAIDLADLPEAQLRHRLKGATLTVAMVDKFPRMTDYIVPTGVRIADTARVRLGAYVGSGTTVMQEGFINFNAGTEGPNMVEGRISAGVWVGAGSDLGGGCSTMGVLSGGNERVISLGKNCLLGANSGLGIPLGDDCTVEAGLYLTGASKVRVLGRDAVAVRTLKAAELAGRSGLLFRRNSLDGAIECLPNKQAIALNADLHTHN